MRTPESFSKVSIVNVNMARELARAAAQHFAILAYAEKNKLEVSDVTGDHLTAALAQVGKIALGGKLAMSNVSVDVATGEFTFSLRPRATCSPR